MQTIRYEELRESITQVGRALREPEEFASRWQHDDARYAPSVWLALGMTAAAGTLCYGMTMGIGHGVTTIAAKGLLLTLAAGLAWAVPLPALYILNSLTGSRLRPSTTLLAALVTTSWGGLALMASVPINWFFSTAIPELPGIGHTAAVRLVLAINLLVFAGVGISMIDVMGRVLARLEPANGRRPIWFLGIVGIIGAQLFYLFQVFEF
jgi:hypothetical protein